MTKDHRRLVEEVAQGVSLDAPDFLKEIVERVLQEFLGRDDHPRKGPGPYEKTTEGDIATAAIPARSRLA